MFKKAYKLINFQNLIGCVIKIKFYLFIYLFIYVFIAKGFEEVIGDKVSYGISN